VGRRTTEGPTEAELEILHVLWQRGPSTVRDVHEALAKVRKTGYTTALKLMQLMAEKGLVKRDESKRSHVYRAAVDQEDVQQKMVGSMLDRLFDGAPEQLLVHALRAKKVSNDELTKIRELLDEYERGES